MGTNEGKLYYNWIASRAIKVGSNKAVWYVHCVNPSYVIVSDFCYINEDGENTTNCLRPVVSLPSSVTIKQVKKIDGEVTETWNDPLKLY